MSDETICGPGMLFVRSRIAPSSKEILDESVFFNWYDEEHIPDVVSTSGIKSGFRYEDIDKTSTTGDARNHKPYLACYPMHDLAFTQSNEFKTINVKSTSLTGSGIIYDLADMDVSYLGFLGATPKKDGSGDGMPIARIDYSFLLKKVLIKIGPGKYIVSFGIKPEKDPGRDKVMAFYEQVPIPSHFHPPLPTPG